MILIVSMDDSCDCGTFLFYLLTPSNSMFIYYVYICWKTQQIPQLTSSRMVDVNTTMRIVPPGSEGVRRAVLIGINYTGQQGELRGCHNDVKNIKGG